MANVSDTVRVFSNVCGLVSDAELSNSHKLNAKHVCERTVCVPFANAADANVLVIALRADTYMSLQSVSILPAEGVADNASNYATWTLQVRPGGVGTSPVAVDSVDSNAADGSKDWAVGTPVEFNIDESEDELEPGDTLELSIAHEGDGVANSGTLVVKYKLKY